MLARDFPAPRVSSAVVSSRAQTPADSVGGFSLRHGAATTPHFWSAAIHRRFLDRPRARARSSRRQASPNPRRSNPIAKAAINRRTPNAPVRDLAPLPHGRGSAFSMGPGESPPGQRECQLRPHHLRPLSSLVEWPHGQQTPIPNIAASSGDTVSDTARIRREMEASRAFRAKRVPTALPRSVRLAQPAQAGRG